ncbi:hypothetical protein LCGC14_1197300, partial [marine sediment metagenome]
MAVPVEAFVGGDLERLKGGLLVQLAHAKNYWRPRDLRMDMWYN